MKRYGVGWDDDTLVLYTTINKVHEDSKNESPPGL